MINFINKKCKKDKDTKSVIADLIKKWGLFFFSPNFYQTLLFKIKYE